MSRHHSTRSSWQPYNRNGALPEFTQAYATDCCEEDELVQVCDWDIIEELLPHIGDAKVHAAVRSGACCVFEHSYY